MNKYFDKAEKLVADMTLEEKAGLCSGLDCWNTKPVKRLGVPSFMVSDGPHGLRKQSASQDNLGIGISEKATCFPTASLVACSFDPELVGEMSKAIGQECLREEVSVLLGPGCNMKRSPLCGRNFEYFSEDPFLSGKLAAGYIKGIQGIGVGTSLKHFAVNNQEKRRMNVSAVMDERALYETYLKAFEIAVKDGKPKTVMCSYNKINGVYSSENPLLLNEVLRKKWGYEGVVISDWGAVHLRPEGVEAGLDLEMPASNGINDSRIINAVREGKLPEKAVDIAATRVTELALYADDIKKKYRENRDKTEEERIIESHHDLAVEVARESMVLLKNEEEVLPLKRNEKIAIIGEFAKKPRYQGAGSSKINPICVDIPFDKLKSECENVFYYEEYSEEIAQCDKAVIFAGLPEGYETEGLDRENMKMPPKQVELIEAVSKITSNVIVVLMGGAPMELNWLGKVKGLLLAYLGGEGVGSAVADLLFGKVSPCGKLAETWPVSDKDAPCYRNFPGDRLNVQYRESIYTGYRFYETAGTHVNFSFGYGLSYSKFEYIKAEADGDLAIRVLVKNKGNIVAKETVMAFATYEMGKVFRPKYELVAFAKEEFAPLEEKWVTLSIDRRELAYYNSCIGDWYVKPGEYNICVGSSLDDLPLRVSLTVKGEEKEEPDYRECARAYYEMATNEFPLADFEAVYGGKVPQKAEPAKRPFTEENCLEDTACTWIGRRIIWAATAYIKKQSKSEEGQDLMMIAAIKEMPFFALMMSSDGLINEGRLAGILEMLNGHFFRGLGKIIKG